MLKKLMLVFLLVIMTSCSTKTINEDGSYVMTKNGIRSDFSKENNQKITWYSDFLCPDCHRAYKGSQDFIEKMVQEGKLEVKYYPLGFLDKYVDNEYSTRSAAWNLGIAEYSPENVEAFVGYLSNDESDVNKKDEKYLENVAKMSEVSEINIKKIKKNMDTYKNIVKESTDDFLNKKDMTKDGRMFVPFIVVNGKVLNGESEDVDSEIVNPIKNVVESMEECGKEEKGCTPD